MALTEGVVEAGPAEIDSASGWVVVAAAFGSMFVVFGVAYSFGAFFTSMADDSAPARARPALMFSITTAWYFALGLVSGRTADRSGRARSSSPARWLLGAAPWPRRGSGSIWLGYVTYGIGVGTAVACAYVPMVAAVGGWFAAPAHRRALGVAVAGIGVGTLVVAPIAERLIERLRLAHRLRGPRVVGAALLLVASVGAPRPPVVVAQVPVRLRARDPRARLRRPLRRQGAGLARRCSCRSCS